MEEEEKQSENPVDAALRELRQGDVLLNADISFLFGADSEKPLTAAAQEASVDAGGDDWWRSVTTDNPGYVIASQSCDVVRPCVGRPFIELCPLVEIKEEKVLEEIRRGLRPQYATLPGLTGGLVVDLDRVMTVEKAVVARFAKAATKGCPDKKATLDFARALGRKRERFAFPDEFSVAMGRIRNRIKEKLSKDSKEGEFYRDCHSVRVRAHPSWEDPQTLELYFLFETIAQTPAELDKIVGDVQQQFVAKAPFAALAVKARALDDITAKLFLEMEDLDFDHLSPDG